MNRAFKIYRLLNVLSIDVALGAVCSSAWLASYFQVHLRVYAYLALGLTVWIIYTGDHLLDAKHITHQANSARHQFHQRYFRTLLGAVMFAILINLVFVFFIRSAVLYSGLLLSIVIALYLVLSKWLGQVKEFFVALLYCGGVLLPIVSIGGTDLISKNMALIVSYFLTALINIILFSWFDRENDRKDNQRSLVLVLGDSGTRKLICFLFITQLVVEAYVIIARPSTVSFVGTLIFMNGILLTIFLNWKWFSANDRYRLAGDAIFFLPLVHLLLVKI